MCIGPNRPSNWGAGLVPQLTPLSSQKHLFYCVRSQLRCSLPGKKATFLPARGSSLGTSPAPQLLGLLGPMHI